MTRRSSIFCLCALVFGALPARAEVNADAILADRPPRALSEFGFFDDIAALVPNPELVTYNLSAPLFSDHADKDRMIFVPGPAALQGDGLPDFPVGSAIIKTFRFGDLRVETRVLMHRDTGWAGFAYVWNADQTDASLKIAGADLVLDTGHGQISYRVPNANQCKACHSGADTSLQPVGPKIRNLDLPGQLERLAAAGVFEMPPQPARPVPDYTDARLPVDIRARAYLDANCAHCHAPGLPADTSGLYLNWEEDRPIHLGIGKTPVAAGRGSGGMAYDIVPGDPAASILHFRLGSIDPGIMMPEIGRSVVDEQGLELIRDWIISLGE